jgi:hypothetical protein
VAAKISLSSGAASERASEQASADFHFLRVRRSAFVHSLVRSVCLEVGPGIFRACDAAGRARLSPRLPILISGGILFALLSSGKGAARVGRGACQNAVSQHQRNWTQ